MPVVCDFGFSTDAVDAVKSQMIDRFYTSVAMARALIAEASVPTVRVVADFAAGQGVLLKAAKERWPDVHTIATDIDRTALRKLRASIDGTFAGVCNFLDHRSRQASRVLRFIRSQVCLAVINPPFSCRGATRYRAHIDGYEISCSLAMSFVLNAIAYLAPHGQILAILPKSCLTSEKDALAIEALTVNFLIERIGGSSRGSFPGCDSSTDFVRLTRRQFDLESRTRSSVVTHPDISTSAISISLFRGKLQVHAAVQTRGRYGVPFVHSTELKNRSVDLTQRRVRTNRSIVVGPAILIPRVGQPNANKIVLYLDRDPIALSDCVIAIRSASDEECSIVYEHLVSAWSDCIEPLYSGTGAQYVTLRRLASALISRFGVGVTSLPSLAGHTR